MNKAFINTSINQRLHKEIKTLLLHRFTLCKFQATDSQNTHDQLTSDVHDQIVFCAFHSFSVEVQMNAG